MKQVVAVALLTAANVAGAQSSVTLFGVVDAGVAVGKGSISDRKQLISSGYNSSRLGFRGTEDLGGGMSASFWLEAGIANDTGQGVATNPNNQFAPAGAGGSPGLTFNRRSTVSLAGKWGELRLGRDLTPQHITRSQLDPFNNLGAGQSLTNQNIITGPTSLRASNSIGYFLPPRLGGVFGQLQYYMGENPQDGAATEDDGTGAGVRLGYSDRKAFAVIGLGRTKYAAGDVRQYHFGAMYDFGFAKLRTHISRDQRGTLHGRGLMVGGTIPVGAGVIRLAYSQYKTDAAGNPRSKKVAVGYVYNLSKRTALYTAYARVKNDGNATTSLNGSQTAPNMSSSGYELGVRQSF